MIIFFIGFFIFCIAAVVAYVGIRDIDEDLSKFSRFRLNHLRMIVSSFLFITVISFGCAVSNKQHNKKIHPAGYWAADGYHANKNFHPDTNYPVKNIFHVNSKLKE